MSNISEYYNPTEPIQKTPIEEIEKMAQLKKEYLKKNKIKYYIGDKQVSKKEFDNQPIEFSPVQGYNNQTLLG